MRKRNEPRASGGARLACYSLEGLTTQAPYDEPTPDRENAVVVVVVVVVVETRAARIIVPLPYQARSVRVKSAAPRVTEALQAADAPGRSTNTR